MDFIQKFYCLYFKDDYSLNQDIRDIFTHENPVIHNFHTFLLVNSKTSLSQLMNKRILINLFQKPATQRIRNRISTADNLARYLF